MKAIQRVVKNGNSAQVTIPRPMLFEQQLRPGDFVEVESSELGGITIRPWQNREHAPHSSVGMVSTVPEPPKR